MQRKILTAIILILKIVPNIRVMLLQRIGKRKKIMKAYVTVLSLGIGPRLVAGGNSLKAMTKTMALVILKI